MFKRFAWFVCVVFTAKNTSSNWMAVGFGVTVPASIVIRLLSNRFVVTSFNHGNCVGVKFRWNPSKLSVNGCDLDASRTCKKKGTHKKNDTLCCYSVFDNSSRFSRRLLLLLFSNLCVDWIIYVTVTVTSVFDNKIECRNNAQFGRDIQKLIILLMTST